MGATHAQVVQGAAFRTTAAHTHAACVGDGGTQVERRRKSSKDAILERVDEKPVMLGVCIKGVLPCGSTQY